MDTDNLPAGSELDQLIAQRIMGWRNLVWREAKQTEHNGSAIYSPAGWYGDGPGKAVYLTDKFSLDIAAAWKVAEKLHKEDYWVIQVKLLTDDWIECHMDKDISRDLDGTDIKSVWAGRSSAPHAICLASLKAVEIE